MRANVFFLMKIRVWRKVKNLDLRSWDMKGPKRDKTTKATTNIKGNIVWEVDWVMTKSRGWIYTCEAPLPSPAKENWSFQYLKKNLHKLFQISWMRRVKSSLSCSGSEPGRLPGYSQSKSSPSKSNLKRPILTIWQIYPDFDIWNPLN